MNGTSQTPVPKPPVLTDEEFDSYIDALARGYSETDIMAAFGINRREYWRIQSAANRRRNRQMWADTKQFRESNRRHEKWHSLADRVMQGDRIRSIKAARRLLAFGRYDESRVSSESSTA